MLPLITVFRKVKNPNSETTRNECMGNYRYTRNGVARALEKLFSCFGAEGASKITPSKAWFQLEDETGVYVFDVYDADYIDVTKTAKEHSSARRRMASEIAKEKREEDDAFLAAVNGEPIPLIINRDGNVPHHVKQGYESGKKLAADIATIGS